MAPLLYLSYINDLKVYYLLINIRKRMSELRIISRIQIQGLKDKVELV